VSQPHLDEPWILWREMCLQKTRNSTACCTTYFDILNRLGVDHQCDRQTDGQTDRIVTAIACIWRRALKCTRQPDGAQPDTGSVCHKDEPVCLRTSLVTNYSIWRQKDTAECEKFDRLQRSDAGPWKQTLSNPDGVQHAIITVPYHAVNQQQ